jgi:predicted enzyme related to lactoylglutathione lyase
MTEQDRFVPGVPNWVDLTTPQPEHAREFYGGLFGWTFSDVDPAASAGSYALAQLDGGAVGGLASG